MIAVFQKRQRSDFTNDNSNQYYILYRLGKLYRNVMEQFRGTKRLVSENICSVEGHSAAIFVSKVSPGIFVIKVK